MTCPPNIATITLAILAGGEGTRMGFPKGDIAISGRPILAHLAEQLAWPGPTLLVTAPGREHPDGADRFDREVTDPVAGEGPLRGILTALEHSTTELTIVATVDMPAITPTQLAFLIDAMTTRADTAGILLTRQKDDHEEIEPFPSIFRRTAQPTIAAQLESGMRAVRALRSIPNFDTLPAPTNWPPQTWTNLNRPSDLEAYRRVL